MISMTRKNHSPKVVVIGGGTGISSILTGLRRRHVEPCAIVTMFDSGGSSGLLSEEFDYPPFGDLRQCLLALSDDAPDYQAFRDAFKFRFGPGTSLNGHSVGNLLLAALTSVSNDVEQAIDGVSRILHVNGQVIPVTLDRADLCAELEDGHIIRGESNIDLRGSATPRIKRIFLDRHAETNPRAVRAVMEADAVVLGPGDLYTSVLPNLLASGLSDAIASCRASRIYVCNLMTKHGETDGFRASDFVAEVVHYMAPATLDWVVVNSDTPNETVLRAYEAEEAYLVRPDVETLARCARGVMITPLVSSELPLRHDSDRVTAAIIKAIDAGRMFQGRGETGTVAQSRITQ